MFELSLHILDLVQNSISAGAALITVRVWIDRESDLITISIEDDGRGMDEALLKRVTSPFATTRKTRKVGLGIPMFKQLTEMCEGSFELQSRPGEGTSLKACFRLTHVDLPPLGDLTGTVLSLIAANPDKPEFLIDYRVNGQVFAFDTREIRKALGGLPLNEPEILSWIGDYLKEGFAAAETAGAEHKE